MQRLPAEWAPQSGVMLTWPHARSDWRHRLAQVDPVFVEIARQVGRREHLLVTCYDEAHRVHVKGLLDGVVPSARLHLYVAPSNDTWVRDHGPIAVQTEDGPALLDFSFNGWGKKYAYTLDDALTGALQEQGAFGATPRHGIDLVLEGGSIDVDGEGTLLTTTRCLLSPMRNPELSREALAARFAQLMGIERVLWLEHGYLAGDDTDSHVDTLARFCDPRTIAYVQCDDPSDEHYSELQAMEAELRAFRRPDGEAYRLVPLPWPRPVSKPDGYRLPATYANFLIINDALLVPTYRDPADAVALARLQECFPEREVIGIDCVALVFQYGSLHCVTMQLPAGVLRKL